MIERLALQILHVTFLWLVIASEQSNSFQIILPQLSHEQDMYQVYEGESLMVCVQAGGISTEVTATVKGITAPLDRISAIGGVDYTPKEFSVTFGKSSLNQTECSEMSIIEDGLDEATEVFRLTLSIDNGDAVRDEKNVSILACRGGDILLRESPRDSFSIVEYCTDQNTNHYWVTLCDGSEIWTAEDASVVCNQANMDTGGSVGHFYIGEKIKNALGMWIQCNGNESKIDECLKTDEQKSDCYPVLVDCSSGSSSGGSNVAAAVSIPIVLLVVGTGISVAIITAVCLLRRRKLQQKLDESLRQVQHNNPNSVREQQSTSHEQSIHTSHSSREHVSNNIRCVQTGADETRNSHSHEADADYTAPFPKRDRKHLVIPPKPTSKQRISAATTPHLFEEAHYEGCDMASLKVAVSGRKMAGHSGITSQYSEVEKSCDGYSQLEHK